MTLLLACNFCFIFFSQAQEKTVLQDLQRALDSSIIYDQNKRHSINLLKTQLSKINPQQLEEKFNMYNRLFDEYKVFKSDSAYFYSLKAKETASKLNDSSLINKGYLNLADIAISVGMYKEALDYLENINIETVRAIDKPMYFGLYGRCYSDMAEYSGLLDFSQKYNEMARFYREKTLKLTEEGSFFNVFMAAFNEYRSGGEDSAIITLKTLLKRDLGLGELGLTNYVLGEIYQAKDKLDLAEYHYAQAAVADIRNSTKESLAIIKLSELLFKRNELEFASRLIQKAFEDAQFYGAQQRKLQVGAILPLIDEEIVKGVESEKRRLYIQYIGAIAFLLISILFTSIIFFQYKKLQRTRFIVSKAHNDLKQTHEQLMMVNEELKGRNDEIVMANARLFESNKIKEEYLGLFFTEYDNIFEKFNSLTLEIKKNLSNEDYKKAIYNISRYNLKKEKEKLLHNFDTAFIKLFPNFINEFNNLMTEGNKVNLKSNQILNKDLRIFALLRLGVKHNEKIAQILGYSVNSIYAYKSKIRNKSYLKNELFDEQLNVNTTIEA